MPPKKKQQQIDINSLPECKSINAIILCKGKKARATNILARIQKQAEKYLFKITKNQVLQHAKQKNIYVDPNTLTDKQKKDPKFMETVNTQLTAAVVAKAVQSLIATLNVKARIQKKNNPQFFADEKRKFDVMYIFEEFPQAKDQFEQIAKIGENLKYVLVVQPKLNWANAPDTTQIDAEKGVGEEAHQDIQEEDQQIKEYHQLLKKQQKTEEDHQYQSAVNKRIDTVRKFRSQSSTTSQFRNTTISQLQSQIDPYNQENSLNELVAAFFDSINKLNAEFSEYQDWRKGKNGEAIPQSEVAKEVKTKGASIASLLDNMAQAIQQKKNVNAAPVNQEQAMLELIGDFSLKNKKKPTDTERTLQINEFNFIGANQWSGKQNGLQEQIRSFLKYPGINRHQMPEVPTKSSQIRRLQQAQYALFLKNKMPLQQFFRRQRLLNFEQTIKDFDEERSYSFTDRVYEEHHNVQSLKREISKATELNQYSSFSKYDESSDKLYLILMYRNNARRVAKKNWESNWKVIPNYEYWLKHFKNNESNLANTHFYDIDYQKIGNIEENVKTFTLQNGNTGAVVISKQCKAANQTQRLLYSIKNDLLFGVRNNTFFSNNKNSKVYHQQTVKEEQYETVVVQDNYQVRIFSNGNVLIENGKNKRIVTPQGYTIIYGNDSNVILHPNGGITYSKDSYVNERGYGLKNGQLYRSQTLQRTAQNAELIKRDDGTVIVQKQGEAYKWIKYFEGTQYLVQGDSVSIQQKGLPFVVCKRGEVKVTSNSLQITLKPKGKYYEQIIQYKDGSSLRLQNDNIQVFQKDQAQKICVNLKKNRISSSFGSEKIEISSQNASLIRKGKTFDPYEDQQKYGEQDVLSGDYIQPRLFIINNDGTGVELISEKAVQNYLKQHSPQIEKVFESKRENFTQVHITGNATKQESRNIKNKLIINLDVFDNSKQAESPLCTKNILLRTLLKYKPLSIDEVADVVKIRNEVQVWRKANIKEENEFGYRPRDQALTKSKIEAKLLTIKIRQQSEAYVDSQGLKQKAKSQYLKTINQMRQIEQQQLKKEALRKQYKKKRDSIIQQYKKLNLTGKKKSRKQDATQTDQTFLDHYFLTQQGKKELSSMPQWVFRAKQRKQVPELDPELRNQLNNTNLNKEEEHSQEQRQRYDTVQVNLNPRREKQVFIKPSVFTQREIDEQRHAFEEEKKAYKFHQAKRKDFNVYGQQRKNMPEVRSLLRTQAISEINQKYLVTQAPLDKKVKISSMKNKLTSSASNMTQMRKEGPHSLLMKTLDKGNDINKLLQKRTMMVQADLNDKLQRDVLITPVEANFGVIIEKRTYQLKIQVKNEDVISQRLTVKRPKSIHVKVAINEMGPIAMGMTRKITVTIKASSEILGKFTDQFDIHTKHEIYHIPIIAHIASENQSKNESLVLSRGVIQVEQSLKKKGENQLQLPRLK